MIIDEPIENGKVDAHTLEHAEKSTQIWLPGAMVARLASIAERTKRLQVRVLRWSFLHERKVCFLFVVTITES